VSSPTTPVDPAGDEAVPQAVEPAGVEAADGERVPAELEDLAASVGALDQLADLPVAEHVARYDVLHGELSDALAAIDGL
jgi:hypothetical protein